MFLKTGSFPEDKYPSILSYLMEATILVIFNQFTLSLFKSVILVHGSFSCLTRWMTVEGRGGGGRQPSLTVRWPRLRHICFAKRLSARWVEIIIDSLLNRTTVRQRRGRSLGVFYRLTFTFNSFFSPFSLYLYKPSWGRILIPGLWYN